MVKSNYGHKYRAISEVCLYKKFKINIWTTFGDIFKFLSRSSYFTMRHDQWCRHQGFRRFNEPGPQAPGVPRVRGPKIYARKEYTTSEKLGAGRGNWGPPGYCWTRAPQSIAMPLGMMQNMQLWPKIIQHKASETISMARCIIHCVGLNEIRDR